MVQVGNKEPVASRVDGNLFEKIQRISAERGLSQSEVVRDLLAQALGEDELIVESKTGAQRGFDEIKKSLNGNSGISEKLDKLNGKLDDLVEERESEFIVPDEKELGESEEGLASFSLDDICSELSLKSDWFKRLGADSLRNKDVSEDVLLIEEHNISDDIFKELIKPVLDERVGYSVENWEEAQDVLKSDGYYLMSFEPLEFHKSLVKEAER